MSFPIQFSSLQFRTSQCTYLETRRENWMELTPIAPYENLKNSFCESEIGAIYESKSKIEVRKALYDSIRVPF